MKALTYHGSDSRRVDLATEEGVDSLDAETKWRTVDALLANAGRGLGHGFLDQEWSEARFVIDTNVSEWRCP